MKPPFFLLLMQLAVCGAAAAQSPSSANELLRQRTLAAACAQCHGTQGKPVAGSTLPPLAGMPAAYITTQMKAFKSGERPATVMHQLAKGYSDEQIEQLAAYFAAQKR